MGRIGVAAFQVHAIPFHSFLELLLYKTSKTQVGGGREEEGQESCGKGWQFRTSFKEETLFSTHKHSSGADTSHGKICAHYMKTLVSWHPKRSIDFDLLQS
ncbi:unnamed protein product [Musa hybrid cultivar]